VAFEQILPTSLIVQNFSLFTEEQRILEGQPPSTTHVRVQREGPFFHIARHNNGAAHSGSAPHKSNSPLVPPPPLEELEDEPPDDELLDALPLLDEELLEACPLLLEEPVVSPPVPLPPEPFPPEPVSGKHCPDRHLNPG
jgi:hypothetical protein